MRHSGFLPLCPWQIFCVVSCWALAPLAVCFAVFRMVRRKSGWGICVLPWFCLFVCCWFLLLWFAKLHVTTGVHVAVFLPTASTHVRTEPLSVIGHTGEKKMNPWLRRCNALQVWYWDEDAREAPEQFCFSLGALWLSTLKNLPSYCGCRLVMTQSFADSAFCDRICLPFNLVHHLCLPSDELGEWRMLAGHLPCPMWPS